MSEFKRIPVAEAVSLLASESRARLVDIRDPVSFATSHVAGALHLTNENLPAFLDSLEESDPVLVLCYHGNSSLGAAHYLASQGFSQVFSVDGGFAKWSLEHPAMLEGSRG